MTNMTDSIEEITAQILSGEPPLENYNQRMLLILAEHYPDCSAVYHTSNPYKYIEWHATIISDNQEYRLSFWFDMPFLELQAYHPEQTTARIYVTEIRIMNPDSTYRDSKHRTAPVRNIKFDYENYSKGYDLTVVESIKNCMLAGVMYLKSQPEAPNNPAMPLMAKR